MRVKAYISESTTGSIGNARYGPPCLEPLGLASVIRKVTGKTGGQAAEPPGNRITGLDR
jgi:hypothetical protein